MKEHHSIMQQSEYKPIDALVKIIVLGGPIF
jgi:hypothetical protein